MSWDKNTVNMSQLDTYKAVLDDVGIPYTVRVGACVRGSGINDEADKIYDLRRLQYNDNVILECIEQTDDCDMDDTIYSEKFKLGDAPSDWEFVRQVAVGGAFG